MEADLPLWLVNSVTSIPASLRAALQHLPIVVLDTALWGLT